MTMKNISTFIAVVFGLALVMLLPSCKSCNNESKTTEELTLADASVVWWMGPAIVAEQDKIFENNGLSVKTFDVQTGLASKNAVLSGSADIGLVATSPLAMGAFNKENLIVLCSYIESNDLLSLITPKNSQDTSLFSKPVAPVAIVKGTISEIYFYNYMQKYFPNQDVTSINQLNVKPPDVGNAVKNGSAKSAVIWEPFATMIASSDSTLKLNRSSEIYTHRIYIVTTPEILKTKRSAIEKFVNSIKQACESLETNPKAIEILKAKFPQQEKSMSALVDNVDFSLKFDYDNMKELILKDAQVAYTLGQTPKDDSGALRQLTVVDLNHYFNHDFKLQLDAPQSEK